MSPFRFGFLNKSYRIIWISSSASCDLQTIRTLLLHAFLCMGELKELAQKKVQSKTQIKEPNWKPERNNANQRQK